MQLRYKSLLKGLRRSQSIAYGRHAYALYKAAHARHIHAVEVEKDRLVDKIGILVVVNVCRERAISVCLLFIKGF